MIQYNKKNKQSGFGLLDVLIAIIVLSISAVAFIKLQHEGMKEVQNTSIRMEGVRIINNVIEAFKANKILANQMMDIHAARWYTEARSKEKLDSDFAGFPNCSNQNNQINTTSSSWCNVRDDRGGDAWRYQELMIRHYLTSDLVAVGNRSGLCITRNPSDEDSYRFTFLWKKVNKNNIKNSQIKFDHTDCPNYDRKNNLNVLDSNVEMVDVYIRIYNIRG